MITAVLFADVVGPAAGSDDAGFDDACVIRLRRARLRTLRQVVSALGGHGVRSLAGGLMAVFASASEAVGCAITMQQAVAGEGAGPPADLQVRVGLHLGECIRYQDDYFGMPVVVAKELCDQAGGGQILASGLVRSVVASRGRRSFQPVGFLRLDGLCEPIPTLDVAWTEGA
jgi:class 3 adenylate cyclase